MSEEVRKIRPARWIDQRTGIIQPYSLRLAQGAAILEACIGYLWYIYGDVVSDAMIDFLL